MTLSPPPVPSSTSTLPPRLRKCSRCDSSSTLLLRKNVPWCTPCAQRAVQQRAKGTLDHARGAALLHTQGSLDSLQSGAATWDSTPQKGGVALGFSGGSSSRALLDITTRSLAPPSLPQFTTTTTTSSSSTSSQPRKARPIEVTRIDVIYIDDSALIPGAQDQTEAVRDIVQEQGGLEAGLNFVPLKLEHIFGDEESEAVECLVGPAEARRLLTGPASPHNKPRDLLLSLFRSLHPPSTSRASTSSARTRSEDLAALLTQVLLMQTARSLGCSALLLGDSASRGAINLIDGIAKGRGHKWPVEGAAAIWRDDILVLRPLRDCFAKELAFYNRTLRLTSLAPRDLVTASVLSTATSRNLNASEDTLMGAGEKASIGRLTENFIFHLEKGVPSTVNTVGRTGDKLVMAPDTLGGSDATATSPAGNAIAPIEATLASLHLPDDGEEDAISRAVSVGTGQKGNRLIQGAKALARWNGDRACPLCRLPAQGGASEWKGKLSIVGALDGQGHVAKYAAPTSSWDTVEAGGGEAEGSIALDKLLCYACLIVLDVPDEFSHVKRNDGTQEAKWTSLPLPPYVLAAARARLDTDRGKGKGKGSENANLNGASREELLSQHQLLRTTQGEGRGDEQGEVPISGTQGGQQRQGGTTQVSGGHVTRKIEREEMRGRVDEFLLEDQVEGDRLR